MATDDRATLEKVAKGYHDLMALQAEQRKLMAKMLRACTAQLASTDAVKRREAKKGLTDLADMLDPKS